MAETVEEKAARLEGRVVVLQWLVTVLVVALIGNAAILFIWKGDLISAAEAAAEEKVGKVAKRVEDVEKNLADEIEDSKKEAKERTEEAVKNAAADRQQLRQGQQQIYSLVFMAVAGKSNVAVPAPAPPDSGPTGLFMDTVGGPDTVAENLPPEAVEGPLTPPTLE